MAWSMSRSLGCPSANQTNDMDAHRRMETRPSKGIVFVGEESNRVRIDCNCTRVKPPRVGA
eukprot:scaffold155250_cov42-Attheya_sp.AAC.2